MYSVLAQAERLYACFSYSYYLTYVYKLTKLLSKPHYGFQFLQFGFENRIYRYLDVANADQVFLNALILPVFADTTQLGKLFQASTTLLVK